MASVLCVASRPALSFTVGTTYYLYPGDAQVQNAAGTIFAEGVLQTTIRLAGTWSKLSVVITANTLNQTLTVQARKNTANGNQVLSIAATTTGEIVDASNTDAVVAGDLWDWSLSSPAGTGAVTLTVMGSIWNPAGNTSKIFVNSGASNFPVGDNFCPLTASTTNNTTESQNQLKFEVAGTLQNLQVNVKANPRTGASTFASRIGGVSGNLTISVTASTTGVFEDNTHSDSIAVGNLVNTIFTGGTGTGNLIVGVQSVNFVSTANQFYLAAMAVGGFAPTINASATAYSAVGGLPGKVSNAPETTEANIQITSRLAFLASNLGVNINANTIVGASTATLRVNGANSALTLSITGLTTGVFEDNTHSVTVVATDTINYSIVGGAAGTSMSLNGIWMVATMPTHVGAQVIRSGAFGKRTVKCG